VLGPFAAVRRHRELAVLLRPPGRATGGLCVLAGVFLAAHFAAWVPSAKLTTVAAATGLLTTQPVWAALIAVTRGGHVARSTWLGIAVAVLGAVLTTGADLGVSGRAVLGDVLALLGGAAAAIYTTYGERARAHVSTATYTSVCYSVCALLLATGCAIGRVPLHGYDRRSWVAIGALTVGAQLLGHSLVNYALHRVDATTVSVLLLLEVPGATLLGWALLHQVPPLRSLPGLAVLVAGVGVVIVGGAHARRTRPDGGAATELPGADGAQPTAELPPGDAGR
jgi:drug/metabolite transporter (DMT)-like permease